MSHNRRIASIFSFNHHITENMSVSTTASSMTIIVDELARLLTPNRFRANNFLFGYIVIALPFSLLFFPLGLNSFGTLGYGLVLEINLTIATVVVMSGLYISVAKKKAIKIAEYLEQVLVSQKNPKFNTSISRVLSIRNQLIWGGVIALTLIFYAFTLDIIKTAPSFTKVLVVIAISYVGLFLGSILFIISFFSEVLDTLIDADYNLKALLPSQDLALRQISDLASSYTLQCAKNMSIVALIVILFQVFIPFVVPLSAITDYVFLGFLDVFVLLSSLIIINYPFFVVHIFLYKVVKKEKVRRLQKLICVVESLLNRVDREDISAIDPLLQIQSLISEVNKSPDSMIEIQSVWKFLGSVALTLLPIIAGIWIK